MGSRVGDNGEDPSLRTERDKVSNYCGKTLTRIVIFHMCLIFFIDVLGLSQGKEKITSIKYNVGLRIRKIF